MSDVAVRMVCDTVLYLAMAGVSLFFFLYFSGAFEKDG